MTTLSTPWHVPEPELQRYAAGSASAPSALSIEAHVASCETCRGRLASHFPTGPLDAIWERIEEDVLAPPLPAGYQLLSRIGLDPSESLLLAAAPALRQAWVLATILVLAFPLLAVGISTERTILAFLLVAPLAPVLGVAFAYGPDADPTYELTQASPYAAPRLLLIRAGAVLAFCVPVSAVAGLMLPGPSWIAVAWLLPALAGVVLVLAASTWLSPTRASVGVVLLWAAAITSSARSGSALGLVGGRVLIAYAVILVAGLLVFRSRAHLLTQMGDLT